MLGSICDEIAYIHLSIKEAVLSLSHIVAEARFEKGRIEMKRSHVQFQRSAALVPTAPDIDVVYTVCAGYSPCYLIGRQEWCVRDCRSACVSERKK